MELCKNPARTRGWGFRTPAASVSVGCLNHPARRARWLKIQSNILYTSRAVLPQFQIRALISILLEFDRIALCQSKLIEGFSSSYDFESIDVKYIPD